MKKWKPTVSFQTKTDSFENLVKKRHLIGSLDWMITFRSISRDKAYLVGTGLTAVLSPAGRLAIAVCWKSYQKIKMARATTYQNSSDFEECISDLLVFPVCMETIKSVPVYQCANGHVICKGCIEKLNNCPICRNDSELRRSLKLEDIVQRLEGIQPENLGSPHSRI